MLNILNREFQRKLFSEDNPGILLSFLNQCFFDKEIKVVEVLGVDELALSFVHCQSCFQETIRCKVKTSDNNNLIVEIDVVRIHNGKDTSLIKMRDKYFDSFIKSNITYAYELPLLYIGLFTFDIGELRRYYRFPKGKNNCQIDFYFLNIEAKHTFDKVDLLPLEQWMYLFKMSNFISSIPKNINDISLVEVRKLLDSSSWNAEDLKSYQKNENQWEERRKRVLDMYKQIGSPLIEEYLKSPATKVSIAISPLFNQLNPRDVKININHLGKESLQKMAFDIFRKWLKETKVKHPQFEVVIKDERLIIEDFESTLIKALKSLFLSDKFYINFNEGWDIGYVLGYISGSLSVYWQHEYIIKQTNNFKLLTAIQVLRDFLKFNDVMKIQLKDLYENFILENVNIRDFDSSVELEDFIYKGKKIEGRSIGRDDTMITVLENIINKQIHKTVTESRLKEVELDIQGVIPRKAIEDLIEKNKPATKIKN